MINIKSYLVLTMLLVGINFTASQQAECQTTAAAQQQIYDYCDLYNPSCTYQQFTNIFMSVAQSGNLIPGLWYNVDLAGPYLSLYNITKNSNGSITVSEMTVDQGSIDYVQALHNLMQANLASFGATGPIILHAQWTSSGLAFQSTNSGISAKAGVVTYGAAPSCPSGTSGQTDNGYIDAFDTVTNPSDEAAVVSNLNSDVNNFMAHPALFMGGIGYDLYQVMVAIPNAVLHYQPESYFIEVTFDDGSSREYAFNASGYLFNNDPVNDFTPVIGTARDCSGNRIPENRRMVAGMPPEQMAVYQYELSTYDFWNYWSQLQAYGIPLNITGTVSDGGVTITCAVKFGGVEICN